MIERDPDAGDRWRRRDASFNRTGKASGRGPTKYHLPVVSPLGEVVLLARCSSGIGHPNRIILDDEDEGEIAPPLHAMCKRCVQIAKAS